MTEVVSSKSNSQSRGNNQNSGNNSQAKQLVAHQIPLTGTHLIEASAGTGKTYNITRIYLRLLLEKNLPVEQILVMTFTKDATEELRARIDDFIRLALQKWTTLIAEDDYFKAIAQSVTPAQAQQRLQQALLFLDEAAIFTIHGFCKRVLSQNAFDSGLPFAMRMESDCQDLLLETCQDYYRTLAHQQAEQFLQLVEFWPHPASFLKFFARAIHKSAAIDVITSQSIKSQLLALAEQALADLDANEPLLTEQLIDVKKAAEREVRQQELATLKQALADIIELLSTQLDNDDFSFDQPSLPDSFADGRRYSRSKAKAQLIEAFACLKQFKGQLQSANKNLAKARALQIARQGIYFIRQRFADKKQQQHMLSFDDLIATLAKQLHTDSQLADIIFNQYPVALVDEFQDTDPDQFAILSAIYQNQPSAALYMIGDPKQAIYGFRGGDVFAYLAARNNCEHQWLMATNWRSSPEMITAYNRLFYGAPLTGEGKAVFGYDIPYEPVKPAPNAGQKSQQLLGAGQALHFVHFTSDDDNYLETNKISNSQSLKASYRAEMAAWCAQEILALLAEPNTELVAQDIAILVRDGGEAQLIKDALTERQLAAVFMSNRANLLASAESQQLLQLLNGILFIENERLYTAALTSPLLAFPAPVLYELQQNELAWQQQRAKFIALRELWLKGSFITMALTLMHEHFVIADQDKDRCLTNLLHLFELLQAASQRHSQPHELLYWFEQQLLADNPEVEAELRLESDDNLIRIITQHGSKGLEYPVVFVPFATRHKDPLKLGNASHTLIEYHDQQQQLRLSLSGSEQAKLAMANEAYAESIRLLYVAITRAERRCYLLTAEFANWQQSPLGKTLTGMGEQQTSTNAASKESASENKAERKAESTALPLLTQLQQLAQEQPQAIAVREVSEHFDRIDHELSTATECQPQVVPFIGHIERDWWLSSFSSLSRNLRSHGVSLPDRDENSISEAVLASSEQAEPAPESSELRFQLAKGAHSGNLLHNILEHCDFSQPNWPELFAKPLSYYGALPLGYDEHDLAQWLSQVVNCPLVKTLATPQGECSQGASATSAMLDNTEPSFSLSAITAQNSLREVEFYYPMNNSQAKQLTEVLAAHRHGLPYVDQVLTTRQVSLPHYQQLKGMMHGFIDLVFEHQGKFYLADHKSTHLGDQYQDYNHSAMRACVESHHYDLQYLIYSLALHRYLMLALPNYNAEQHFGGVYYLFLRGMSANPEHQGCGVYYRQIELAELERLDALFGKGNSLEPQKSPEQLAPIAEDKLDD